MPFAETSSLRFMKKGTYAYIIQANGIGMKGVEIKRLIEVE